MARNLYIPALRFDRLTPVYDPVVRFATRERIFKNEIVNQARIIDDQSILDLVCGTGTLTAMLKELTPNGEVTGIDADTNILRIAAEKTKKRGVGD